MKKLLISVFALSGALLWGCEEPNEEPTIDYNSQALKIAATIEQTRTSVTSSSVAWAAGDEIKLVCENEEYAFTTAAAGESAEFTSTTDITPATIEGCAVMAYYGCNSLGAYTIAQNQSVVGGVNQTKVPMYAYTNDAPEQAVLPLTFKPAASVLEVVLGSKAITVESISLSPAVGAMVTGGGICGTFNVNALTGKVSAKNTLETITVTFDQSQNLESGLSVQIPIGWCTITGGLKLSISYNDGSLYEDVLWTGETVNTYAEVDGVQTYKYFTTNVEIDLGPRDWYVKADGDANAKGWNWEKATTLSNALVNAAAGSTIHIAAGTYTPENYILGADGSNNAHKTFEVSKGLTLVGGYPADATTGAVADAANNASVLDGTLDEATELYAYHVLLVTSPEKVVLEGLTIQGGDNKTAEDTADVATGAGCAVSSVNEAIIEDKSGAGVYVAAAEVEMNGCVVANNDGKQAVVFAKEANLTINNSTIKDNTSLANGGGVWLWNGELTINDSTISNNGDAETAGIGRGLYVYGEKENSAKATINNTTISGNLSRGSNYAGFYVRGADATADIEATFTNCTISANNGGMGAAGGGTFSKVTLDGCDVVDHTIEKYNGILYFLNNAEANIINCRIANNTTLGNAMIYIYSNTEGCGADAYIANTVIENNKAADRGSAFYVRSDAPANVNVTCVNSTIANNSGATTLHTYAKNSGVVALTLISSTVVDNVVPGSAAKGAVLSEETAGTTINIHNTIVANNTAESTIFKNDQLAVYSSVVDADVYGADGAVVEDKTFNVEELGAYAEGVYPVATTSVAYTDGMSASDLFTLGSGINADIYTEAIMGADQKGNARTGNVMGAYVGE